MFFWSYIRSLFRRKREPDPQILIVEGGFNLASPPDGTVVDYVRWNEVTRIHTYKIDLLTTDCICLLFEFSDGKPPLQVSDMWEGFTELFTPMAESFPSIPQNWYLEVMFPAFETNHSVLYESAHSTESQSSTNLRSNGSESKST